MMQFKTILKNPAEWMMSSGPNGEIVISSRVRLARNLKNLSFPGWAIEEDRSLVLNQVKPVIESLTEMRGAFSSELTDLNAVKKQVLVERHLISREQAAKAIGSAAVMNRKQTLCIMVNEEDHLRMQSIKAGLNLSICPTCSRQLLILEAFIKDFASKPSLVPASMASLSILPVEI